MFSPILKMNSTLAKHSKPLPDNTTIVCKKRQQRHLNLKMNNIRNIFVFSVYPWLNETRQKNRELYNTNNRYLLITHNFVNIESE